MLTEVDEADIGTFHQQNQKTQLPEAKGQVVVIEAEAQVSKQDMVIYATTTSRTSARPFRTSWLDMFQWLVFDEAIDRAFCNICKSASEKHLLENDKYTKTAFISDGFNN